MTNNIENTDGLEYNNNRGVVMDKKSDKKLTEEEIREILRKPKMREVIHQMANEILIRQWENERKDNSYIDESL